MNKIFQIIKQYMLLTIASVVAIIGGATFFSSVFLILNQNKTAQQKLSGIYHIV